MASIQFKTALIALHGRNRMHYETWFEFGRSIGEPCSGGTTGVVGYVIKVAGDPFVERMSDHALPTFNSTI